jgi:hypothetical protein
MEDDGEANEGRGSGGGGRKWRSNAMRSVTCSGSTVANGIDDGDGDRARGREIGCLACCWCRGDARGRSEGQGKDGVDGATSCSGTL